MYQSISLTSVGHGVNLVPLFSLLILHIRKLATQLSKPKIKTQHSKIKVAEVVISMLASGFLLLVLLLWKGKANEKLRQIFCKNCCWPQMSMILWSGNRVRSIQHHLNLSDTQQFYIPMTNVRACDSVCYLKLEATTMTI